MYLIEKTINKLFSDGYTFFLDPNELNDVTSHLKKNTYQIYKPYPDSEKNIIYLNNIPEIILLEIIIPISVRHQDILGSLYHLGISDNLFGDIVITNNHYYFYTFKNMQAFFELEFTKVKNAHIKLEERDISFLLNYQHEYEEIKIITSSLRIDSIIAKVIHTNRENVKELIKEKKIFYNYDLLKDNAKIIHENDIFSIRKYGKYKFQEVLNTTKKDNLIIKILKYIDK